MIQFRRVATVAAGIAAALAGGANCPEGPVGGAGTLVEGARPLGQRIDAGPAAARRTEGAQAEQALLAKLGREYGAEVREAREHGCDCRVFDVSMRRGGWIGEFRVAETDPARFPIAVEAGLFRVLKAHGFSRAIVDYEDRPAVEALMAKYGIRLDANEGWLHGKSDPALRDVRLWLFDGKTILVTLSVSAPETLRVVWQGFDGTRQQLRLIEGRVASRAFESLPPIAGSGAAPR